MFDDRRVHHLRVAVVHTGQPMAPADDVLTSAGYLLLKAGHYISIELETALASLGLTGRELLVMSYVRATEGLSQQGLSARLGLDPTLVVALVDSLEERSFVRRTKDPADRRRNILSLSADGIAVHDAAVAAAQRAEDSFLEPLTPRQRTQLRTTLRAVMAPRLPWLEA
jgi:DNA-binding MarR family transcriptional regulator